MKDAMITMTLGEWDEFRENRQTAENRAAELEKKLADTKVNLDTEAGQRIQSLNELARHLMSIARFAVSQMPPEATKGWPADRVRKAVALFAVMPDYTSDDRDLGGELVAFCAECERYDEMRKLGKFDPKPASPIMPVASPLSDK